MSKQERHGTRVIGTLLTGETSFAVHVGGASKGMLVFNGGNSDIKVQCSPDGGSTWHDLYAQDGTQVFDDTPVGPGGQRTIPIRVLPQDLRCVLGGPAAMVEIAFDISREIA